jgi:hypothetical protein
MVNLFQDKTRNSQLKIFSIIILALLNQLSFGQKANENLFYFKDTLKDFSNNELYSGNYISYYPGDRKFVGSFINGLKQGEFIYYKNPKESCGFFGIDSIVNYNKGKLEGQKLVYFHSYCSSIEFIQQKLNYYNGKLDGTCYYWNNSLQLEKIIKYKADKIVDEKEFEIDSTISFLIVKIKEFPSDTVELGKLTNDSLTLEILGEVVNYDSNNTSITTFKKLNNYTIKSFMVIKQMKFQTFISNKIASYIFKHKSLESSGKNVLITDIVIIDKNNVEYKLPSAYFAIK